MVGLMMLVADVLLTPRNDSVPRDLADLRMFQKCAIQATVKRDNAVVNVILRWMDRWRGTRENEKGRKGQLRDEDAARSDRCTNAAESRNTDRSRQDRRRKSAGVRFKGLHFSRWRLRAGHQHTLSCIMSTRASSGDPILRTLVRECGFLSQKKNMTSPFS